jgi:hypothetical protein
MPSRSGAGNVTYRVPRALRRKISRSEDLCMTVAASLLVGMFNHNSSRIQPHIATHTPGRSPMLLPCHGCLIPCQLAWTELFAIAGRRPPWIAPMSVVFDSRSHGASFRSVFGRRQPLPQHRKDHGFLAPKEQTSIPIMHRFTDLDQWSWKPRISSLSMFSSSRPLDRLRPSGLQELGRYTDDMAVEDKRLPLLGPSTSLPSRVSLAFSPWHGRLSPWYSTLR